MEPPADFSALSGSHVVMAGNPGVGKSAILNCLLQRAEFRSGVRLGRGMTSSLDTVTCGDVTFSDTPGLDDTQLRKQAAAAISKLFQGGGCFKMVFVITLEAGRLKPADMETIRTILRAAEDIGVQTAFKYSVIINKCDQGTLEAVENSPEDRALLEGTLGVNKTFNHIAYMRLVQEAVGKENWSLGSNHHYLEFLANAPSLILEPSNQATVKEEGYDDRVQLLQAELEQLRKEIAQALETPQRRKLFRLPSPVSSFVAQLLRRGTGIFKL